VEPRVSLVTLGVGDLKRSVGFYRDGLGWPKSQVGGDEVAFFKTGGVVIALFPRTSFAADADVDVADVEHGGFARFSLAHNVVEEGQVDSVLADAAQAGATIVKEAKEIFSGATGFSRTPTAFCGRWRGTPLSRWPRTAVSSCPTRHLVAGTADFEKASSPKSGVQGQTGGPRCAPDPLMASALCRLIGEVEDACGERLRVDELQSLLIALVLKEAAFRSLRRRDGPLA
jgi:catechol 2,3-dioxygenase-like lactoylglutathione lyase family enzyme